MWNYILININIAQLISRLRSIETDFNPILIEIKLSRYRDRIWFWSILIDIGLKSISIDIVIKIDQDEMRTTMAFKNDLHILQRWKKYIYYTGCSLNIVFFLKMLWFFWTLPVRTHWHRGETERGQSPEHILKSSKLHNI